jgi:hypothetical protein
MSKKASLAEALKKTETQEKSEIKTKAESTPSPPLHSLLCLPAEEEKKPLTVYIDPLSSNN